MSHALHAYLDECVDTDLREALRWRGIAASHVDDQGMKGRDDAEQFTFAADRGWVLVTHNLRHFRPFHERCVRDGRAHGGIVGLPAVPGLVYPLRLTVLAVRTAMLLDHLAALSPPHTQLLSWGVVQRRLEARDVPPGFTAEEVAVALRRDG